jgi:sn-glycerol 3-phosphate transport system ATP-binding protein
MAELILKDLSKVFDGTVAALNRINLTIGDGEFLVLLGPSGCGKSTLLRLIAGLEQPDSGDILLDGKSLLRMHPKNRNVAMVFQEYALYPHMTVRENLSFPLKMKRLGANEIETAVERTSLLTGLHDLLHRRPKQLSGGQRQRVALGRAIIREPSVFLFDEPLSNLDFNLRINLRGEIAELHRRTGITTVYVTHDQQEALALGTRIGILKEGRLVQCDCPADIYNRPADSFVAQFVGTPKINMIDGLLKAGKYLSLKSEQAHPCRLIHPIPGSEIMDRECRIGIRAHYFKMIDAGKGPPAGLRFRMRLKRVENQGESYLGEFMLDEKLILVRLPHGHRIDIDNDYLFEISPDDILLFDTENGKRIYP